MEVTGLAAETVAALAAARWSSDDWAALLTVEVRRDVGPRLPAVSGTSRADNGAVRFEPRYPFEPGVRYRATFDPSRLPGRPAGQPITTEFAVPKAPALATTVVRHVYPTRDVLPENQLKFYLHFSAPMARGEAFEHVRLLDSAGKEVEGAFLVIDEELWDREQMRFTLLFDPSRVKRGLRPHEEIGRALQQGKDYTLVVDRAWPDAKGNPLKETHRKRFRAAAPDETPLDPKTWKVEAPREGGRDAVVVRFGEPLDHALMERLVRVVDAAGREVDGTTITSDEETRWRFEPAAPWRSGSYRVVVDTALEDLAGNAVGRPFEVDVFHPIRRHLQTDSVSVTFRVGK